MKLVHAFGINIRPGEDYPEASNPDRNGGFGIGTENIWVALVCHWSGVDHRKFKVAGRGVVITHTFSDEECRKVAAAVTELINQLTWSGSKAVWEVPESLVEEVFPHRVGRENTLQFLRVWLDQLVTLFTPAPGKVVSYYWAG